MSDSRDLGVIGLGVMGSSLVLNMADNGYSVAAFDLDHEKGESLLNRAAEELQERQTQQQCVQVTTSYTELLQSLRSPRILFLSVPAGPVVDDVCEKLIDAGIQADDIVVDTGNSLWSDTEVRQAKYKGKFIFFSTAVSGGELGARHGPALMAGGDKYAWTRVGPVLEKIAAKVDSRTGKPTEEPSDFSEACAAYIGSGGAGHYVKMVHNGIEYADMQLICEAFQYLNEGLELNYAEIADIFESWLAGPLDSYLLEVSVAVLRQTDPETQAPLMDVILDMAGQKGTGRWTAINSLELGAPAMTIAQSVYARALSARKDARVRASKILDGPLSEGVGEEKQSLIDALHDALLCAKVSAYAQGFELIALAAEDYEWKIDYGKLAKIWRAGCIIRAKILGDIAQSYADESHAQENLLISPVFAKLLSDKQPHWRKTVAKAVELGIPVPCLSSSIAYYDGYRCERLPANLLQGQRDFFGAHGFQRLDRPGTFHLTWEEKQPQLVQFK